MPVDRISTLDSSYKIGDLSIFPHAIDTKDQLYQVSNNAETVLTQSMTYNATYFVVNDASSFPSSGIANVGTELIYFSKIASNTFQNLKRGFAGSTQNQWPAGTTVTCSVTAEPHNALKDATFNIQTDLGTVNNPTSTSLNGILKSQENRFLCPKPIFRAEPKSGPAPMTVAFQNFSTGYSTRYLWDFGDGQTSTDVAPTHVYVSEGIYTVSLNMISNLNGQGMSTKSNYITVDNSLAPGYYYVTPATGIHNSTVFTFVDQTQGNVQSRYWIFDDGATQSQLNPDIHTTTHVYTAPGTYNTALIVVFANQKIRRYTTDPIIVS